MSAMTLQHTRLLLFLLIVGTLLAGVLLSFPRDAKQDEALYIHETAIMADCLRAGHWFGNESVGLHGFLFKIPAALVFLVVGPSVFAATLVTVALGGVAAWLGFRFLRQLLGDDAWALAGTWLLITNFQFLRLIPTFNRDIPALVAFLLFMDAVLSCRNRWVVGLCLLLVLDAKEYLFFMAAPAVVIWVVWEECSAHKGLAGALRWVAARLAAAFLPAAIYLFLMFFTGVVPLNMFAARALGLTDPRITRSATAPFAPEEATRSEWKGTVEIGAIEEKDVDEAVEPVREAQHSNQRRGSSQFLRYALRYVGKVFYPSMFSFAGIPKALALPALLMSFVMFLTWRRRGDTGAVRLCLLAWVFFGFYLLLAGSPRYMLPLYPLLIAFFLMFLREGPAMPRFTRWTMTATVVFVALGLCFSPAGLFKKMAVNAMMLAAIGAALWTAPRRRRAVALGVPILVGVLCAVAAMRYSLDHRFGQIHNYRLFGYDRECRKVVAALPPDDRVWLNASVWNRLPLMYRDDRPHTPEWQGSLKGWVPKCDMLHINDDVRTFLFAWYDNFDFRKKIRQHHIQWVALLVSHVRGREFSYQAQFDMLRANPWLELEQTLPFKNKTLYLFRYIEM